MRTVLRSWLGRWLRPIVREWLKQLELSPAQRSALAMRFGVSVQCVASLEQVLRELLLQKVLRSEE
ncbi:MAG: hypothetical protein SNJ72_09405 [Fimbriimonadales bacterium]